MKATIHEIDALHTYCWVDTETGEIFYNNIIKFDKSDKIKTRVLYVSRSGLTQKRLLIYPDHLFCIPAYRIDQCKNLPHNEKTPFGLFTGHGIKPETIVAITKIITSLHIPVTIEPNEVYFNKQESDLVIGYMKTPWWAPSAFCQVEFQVLLYNNDIPSKTETKELINCSVSFRQEVSRFVKSVAFWAWHYHLKEDDNAPTRWGIPIDLEKVKFELQESEINVKLPFIQIDDKIYQMMPDNTLELVK